MRSPVTGELVAGPETLSPDELDRNRSDIVKRALEHPLDDQYHRERDSVLAQGDRSNVVSGQLGRAGTAYPRQFRGVSPRGLFGEVVGGTRRHPLDRVYSSYGVDLQKRFFGYFLKGEDTGWDRQPRVLLNIRHPGGKMVPERKANGPSNVRAGPVFISILSIGVWARSPRQDPPR